MSLAATLAELVREEIRRRGLADPASVRVEALEKRHPLAMSVRTLSYSADVTGATAQAEARHVTLALEADNTIALDEPERELGPFPPGRRRIDFTGVVARPSMGEMLLSRLIWQDSDGSAREEEQLIELAAQERNVEWEALEYQDPYPLEAVTASDRFVGRKALLHELTKAVLGEAPGNVRIVGQRRVGKTSIAYALASHVERIRPGAYKFVFLQSGDFNANTAAESVQRLGESSQRPFVTATSVSRISVNQTSREGCRR